MRRLLLVAAALRVLASLTAVVILIHNGANAADPFDPKNKAEPPAAASTQLPISKVILYSSGVGYFQREGKVKGNTRVDLSFPVQDVNDLLKSMVLRDKSGGHVSAVSYDSHAPVEKTLKSFAINLNNNPGFGEILQQARGEKVEVVLQQSNATQPGTLTGSIIGIEKVKQAAAKDAVLEVDQLNLWCAEGIRNVKLVDVQRLRFLNPLMESEVRKALETLSLSHDTQKKAVSISFTGEGERDVTVGYVVENPIWKTSYRLVLGKEGKPFLQGWAIVENPSDEDWGGVGMVLVSGRPISFQMDLYQPLYVPRPTVVPELFASLRPQTYNGDMGLNPDVALNYNIDRIEQFRQSGVGAPPPASVPMYGGYPGTPMDAPVANTPVPLGKPVPLGLQGGRTHADKLRKQMEENLNLGQGVQSAATAGQLGDFFQYVIDQPVSLARQKSAMLPIVNKDVEGERVSIYNQNTHAKFPLLGLKFKNTSGLHLMQGPITVFEGSAYAGDARVLDVQPNEERLISYAVDLGTEVDPVVDDPKHTLIKVKVVKGVIYTTTKVVESKTYKVANRSEQDRALLIEHPLRADFKVTSKQEPVETTRDVYRFQAKVPAKKSTSVTVVEEKDLGGTVVLSNSDDNQIRHFVQSNVSSKAVQDALKKALDIKGQRDLTRQEITNLDQQLQDLERDQTRIRNNMNQVPVNSDLHKKYLAKLTEQESEVDRLRDQIKAKRAEDLTRTKQYDTYLANLDVE